MDPSAIERWTICAPRTFSTQSTNTSRSDPCPRRRGCSHRRHHRVRATAPSRPPPDLRYLRPRHHGHLALTALPQVPPAVRAHRAGRIELSESSRRTPPVELDEAVRQAETSARTDLTNLKEALSEQQALREIFMSLFPEGLEFSPVWAEDQTGKRRVWRITWVPRSGAFPIAWRPQRFAAQIGPRFPLDFPLFRRHLKVTGVAPGQV